MKTYFTLLMIVFLTINLQGQNYESLFGEDSTRWNITMSHPGLLATVPYITKNDTILNGNIYTKIGISQNSFYQGFLRQDSTHSKAWYIGNSDTIEYLVMDLNLNVGDSMYLNIPYNGQFSTVDSVYFFNNRKHIQFDFATEFIGYHKFTMIEGVVSSVGFMFVDEYTGIIEEANLLCAYKDGIQVFDIGTSCYLIGGSTNGFVKRVDFKVFPNPTTDFLNIERLEENFDNYTFKIIDLTGKIIKTAISENLPITTISITQLNAGFYYLLIYNEDHQLIGREKIMIQ